MLHNISLPRAASAGRKWQPVPEPARLRVASWLARLRGLRVSAHFFIRRDGAVIQFVSTEDRAWHAGVSRYAGRERCNDFSIGIELEGTDTLPYADAQYQALRQLALRARATRWPPPGI